MNYLSLLKKIAKHGIEDSSKKDIIEMACAYWHDDFLPDLEKIQSLPLEQQKIIGYITEFFSTFNCVEKDRAKKLVQISNKIKTAVKPVSTPSNNDEIAAEWGLTENLNKFHKDILFYQTRHYQHGQDKTAQGT